MKDKLKKEIDKLPSTIGVYLFLTAEKPIYIGKSVNIKARVLSHLENAKLDRKEARIVNSANGLSYRITDSEFKSLILESELIKKYQPKYNVILKDDKSYLYIKVSTQDLYPKISLARKPKQFENGFNYFGPFPSKRSVEEILKEIRKIIPYCSQVGIRKKPCFYSKIKLCSPCPSYINSLTDLRLKKNLTKIYLDNIKQIISILQGKIMPVITILNRKLNSLSKLQKYEEALIMRNKIYRFEHYIHSQNFSDWHHTQYNYSEKSLKSLLVLLQTSLPEIKSLHRIESYDVSNLSAKDATASMVVFTNGISDKKEYRKFRIKNTELASDFEMLSEAISRRIRQKWLKPDLIVIDGGRPQLRFVSEMMKSLQVNVPLVGIAKNPDRLVTNSLKHKTIRPPLNNLGFNLIRQVRDESHRFAKKYHLFLRNKRILYN